MKIITFFISLLIISISHALDVEVVLKTDLNEMSLNEQTQIVLEITGSKDFEIKEIKGGENFTLEENGVQTSFQVGSGGVRYSTSKIFNLSPKKEGEWVLGPFVVEVDGEEFLSNKISFNILKEKKEKAGSNQNYFIETSIDKKSSYLSEQIIYSMKFYWRTRIDDVDFSFPQFNGFWKKQIGDVQQYRELKNGYEYQIAEVKYALFPSNTGLIKIEAPKINFSTYVQAIRGRRNSRRGLLGQIFDDSFFNQGGVTRKKVTLEGDSFEIQVKSLPPYSGPEKYSGLVGEFNFSSEIDKNRIKQGESVTLTLDVFGHGNIFDLQENLFLIENVKSYDDRPQINEKFDRLGFFGQKIFKKAIVPNEKGPLNIPGFSLVVFDPKKEDYVLLKTSALTIEVLEDKNISKALNYVSKNSTNQLQEQKEKIQVLGKDIMPIIQAPFASSEILKSWPFKVFIYFSFLFMPILYFCFRIFLKRKSYFEDHSAELISQQAYKKFLKGLKNLQKKEMNVSELSFLVKDYLGEKLAIDGRSLTALDIERIFSTKKISNQLVEGFKSLFKNIDLCLFGGGKGSQDILTTSKNLVAQFEKEVK